VLGKAQAGLLWLLNASNPKKSACKRQNRPRRCAPTLRPEPITARATLALWFPVRLAGAEVTEAFWASAAVLSRRLSAYQVRINFSDQIAHNW
jgi:hypothetical protein